MVDPGSVNSAISLVQKVIKLGKKATNLQYEEALLAAREAMFNLREENLDLKVENQNLNERLKQKDDFLLEKGVYWKREDTDRDQPFCPACYSKGKIIPLQKHWEGKDKKQSPWICPEKSCNASYNPWDYKEPDYTPEWQGFLQ